MERQPILVGERLTLRPLHASDFEPLYAIAADPLIWAQHPDPNRYKRDVFLKFFEQGLASQGSLIATDNQTDQLIGTSRFVDFNLGQRSVEIGYTFLARGHWGQGYNEEMKALMLRHAFNFVDTVIFKVGSCNKRSILALEKIGATLFGKFERNVDEKFYVVLVYKLEHLQFSFQRMIEESHLRGQRTQRGLANACAN